MKASKIRDLNKIYNDKKYLYDDVIEVGNKFDNPIFVSFTGLNNLLNYKNWTVTKVYILENISTVKVSILYEGDKYIYHKLTVNECMIE